MLQKLIERVLERGPGHLEGSLTLGAVGMGTFLVPSPGDSEAGREVAIIIIILIKSVWYVKCV